MPTTEYAKNVLPRNAAEWELYTSHRASEGAAEVLTQALEDKLAEAQRKIAAGADAYDEAVRVRDEMYRVMNRYQKLGARDTEPEVQLVTAIETALNLDTELSR